MNDLNNPLQHMHDSAYTWGSCQALLYDPARTDIFPGSSYLVSLYDRCLKSGRGRLGILPALFCGMRDLSCEAIVAYLHQLPVVVVGEWCQTGFIEIEKGQREKVEFVPVGFCFPTGPPALARQDRQPSNRNSLFAGYAFFEEAWRTPQQTVCMYLGLSYLFYEFKLAAIHGVRFADNFLTARWCRRFGFRDLGMIPNYLYRWETGDLASAVVSSLDREEFAARLRAVLANLST